MLNVRPDDSTQYEQNLTTFRAALKQAYGGSKAHVENLVQKLAVSARKFFEVSGNQPAAAQEPRPAPQYSVRSSALSSPSIHFANDPFFWYMLGRSHEASYRPAYGSRGCCQPSYGPSSGSSCCPTRRNGGGTSEDKDSGKALLGLAVIGVALIDLAAIAGGVFWIAYDSVQAANANAKKTEFREIAQTLKGDHEGLNKETVEALRGIGENLDSLGTREAKYRTVRAVGTGFASVGAMGIVHTIFSLMAMAAIPAAKTVAFFAVCTTPPFLIALSIIAAVGVLIYVAVYLDNRKKTAQDRANAQQGLTLLQELPRRFHSQPEPGASELEGKVAHSAVVPPPPVGAPPAAAAAPKATGEEVEVVTVPASQPLAPSAPPAAAQPGEGSTTGGEGSLPVVPVAVLPQPSAPAAPGGL